MSPPTERTGDSMGQWLTPAGENGNAVGKARRTTFRCDACGACVGPASPTHARMHRIHPTSLGAVSRKRSGRSGRSGYRSVGHADDDRGHMLSQIAVDVSAKSLARTRSGGGVSAGVDDAVRAASCAGGVCAPPSHGMRVWLHPTGGPGSRCRCFRLRVRR